MCQVSSTWICWVVCFFKELKPLRGLRVMMSLITDHMVINVIGIHYNGL